jgi:type III restriction enzyme
MIETTSAEEARNVFGLADRWFRNFIREIAAHPKVERVLIYGSRARGDYRDGSDIDLAVDAPTMTRTEWSKLMLNLEDSPYIVKKDIVHLRDIADPKFRARILVDGKEVFRRGGARPVDERSLIFDLKQFQQRVLDIFDAWLEALVATRATANKVAALKVQDPTLDIPMADFPAMAWEILNKAGRLPAVRERMLDGGPVPYSPRYDGLKRSVPNACLKIPTGGGKTLLAAACATHTFSKYFRRNHGLVLWIVPNEAIYSQTKKTLSDRDHPYRQLLDKAAAGKVKTLEKNSPLAKEDVDSHLCVMLLMLASAARRDSENTLRFFRDRGNVRGFFPREDDLQAHWALKQRIPNLDVYGRDEASLGLVVRDSLGNAMRASEIMVVVDEGQKAYSPLALKTVYDFNPALVLELSATPRDRPRDHPPLYANWLVDVRGTDLEREELIKLPIQVERRAGTNWKDCLRVSLEQLNELQREADTLLGNTGRYVRPILLVQTERTGKDQLDSGYIHAQHVREYLAQLGVAENAIAEKTAETDELKQPENIDLLSPACPVRVIVTKQALQEGWDCPFAYVLCALGASHNMAAMTQLLGRILRQPQAAKTGNPALDSCYVYCFQVQTGDVVQGIKAALESEGMGDLAIEVRETDGENAAAAAVIPKIKGREAFAGLQVFLPRVLWVDEEGARPLDYERDVLSRIPWTEIQIEKIADRVNPNEQADLTNRILVDLRVLDDPDRDMAAARENGAPPPFDSAYAARSLFDVVPNAWLARELVGRAITQLRYKKFADEQLAALSSRIVEEIGRVAEQERDRLAEEIFLAGVAARKIQFRLRADGNNWTMPSELPGTQSANAPKLRRPSDDAPVEKSLFAPVYRAEFNELEGEFACYLDEQKALRWWHRNVARSQYSLQGWKKQRVYPDFVFALDRREEKSRVVVMETKGLHLQNEDTEYKQKLLARLSEMFALDDTVKAGQLQLTVNQDTTVECDLVFDQRWKSTLAEKYFS